MKTIKNIKNIKKFLPEFILVILTITLLNPLLVNASSNSNKVIYPLKQVSKLDCRFSEFSDLSSNCKQNLPILKTKDYKKYAALNGGYNDYTRLYTMLWGASYKYGWDVGNGGHIGTDIATSKGTPVYTIADGKVLKAKKDIMLGNMISIQHTINGKKIISNYAHLSKIDVKVGDKIKVGKKIGEVGSTGNSTGNHLHFQIDLDTPFHPYYYDYSACPFSYYKITEEGVCFDELRKNTIDPLLFLETRGAILDNISTPNITTTINNNENLSIFNKTVYIGYSKLDIKEVQQIFKKIGAYKGPISGNYKDIEESIIQYQISNKLIENRKTYGAGRFGPKTRHTVKIEYLALKNKEGPKVYITNPKIKVEKISKTNLMSREEIEQKEVENFLKNYNIQLDFSNQGSNIKKNTTEILKLKITNKRGKVFKGEMPGGMTFIVNTKTINVFPQKLFYFTDGKRDIRLTGLNEGNTNLYIKIGGITIKKIRLKVYDSNTIIYPDSAKIISSNQLTIGDNKTGIVLFKDSKGKNLINLPYGSTFNIKASNNNQICIKRGNIKDVKKIYKQKCNESDYKNEHNFTYNDTVGGLLIYQFKANSKNFNITLKNNYNNDKLYNKKIIVSNPKGLNKTYVYSNDIMNLLEKGIVNGIKSGYFLEERELTQKDAFIWTKNALVSMQKKSNDKDTNNKIQNNLIKIDKAIKYSSKYNTITRKDFLDITYKYLVLNENNYGEVSYRDIDEKTNIKVANIFNNNVTWKDKFGKKYFRPDEKITRGEGAFFLAQSLNRISHSYLTLK